MCWWRIAGLLALLSRMAVAGVCTGHDDGDGCLMSDGQTQGTCASGACERIVTIPGGETRTGTGTIDVAADGTITGTGTAFDAELHVGDLVQCAGGTTWWSVAIISSATSLNAFSACVTGVANPCPTCTGAAFTFLNPIQALLDEHGNVVRVWDAFGREGVGPTSFGGVVTVGNVRTYLPADRPGVSSGDGIDAGISDLLGAAAGGATSAANHHGGAGEAISHQTGGGGAASGGGTSKGGRGGVWSEAMGDAGPNTGAGASAAGGDGGDRTFTGSAGGESTNGDGGNAGNWIVTMRDGGACHAGGCTSGDGGSIEFRAGNHGAPGSPGADGHLYMLAAGEHRLTGNPLKLNGAAWPADAPGALFDDGAGGLDFELAARLLSVINRPSQTANITDTTITGTAGSYQLSVYVVDTAADITAGAVTVNIKFNDGSAGQTVAVGPVVLTTLGAMAQATVFADLASGNLTYGSTHTGLFGTAAYRVKIIPQRLS